MNSPGGETTNSAAHSLNMSRKIVLLLPIKGILAPVDFSEFSFQALQIAAERAGLGAAREKNIIRTERMNQTVWHQF